MRIKYSLPDYDIACDVASNPEFILMMAEGDEDSCYEQLSLWLAGQAVTRPETNDYDY